ncbi:MAG: hypothetical protein QNL04_12375 [SAR324 cluster bacterium]|nr:hypothetical protein [SAR324 cluster bacterium]
MFNAKNLSILAILLWVVTIAAIGTMMVKGNTVASDDQRVAIELSLADKKFVAKEMRSFLNTIMLVSQAAGENRMEDISELAYKNGMHEVEMVPPRILVQLPMEFKQIGMEVHNRFDALSKKAKEGITQAEVNQALGDIINGCMACHNSYQIVLKDIK